MNENIIKEICLELNIKEYQAVNTLNLLSEGATIPFIARYRKEATGTLDENQISKINEVYTYQVNLLAILFVQNILHSLLCSGCSIHYKPIIISQPT